jgi:hypothetical protein
VLLPPGARQVPVPGGIVDAEAPEARFRRVWLFDRRAMAVDAEFVEIDSGSRDERP